MAQRPLNPAGGEARVVAAKFLPDDVAALDALAARAGTTKSELVRRAVLDLLTQGLTPST